MGAWLAVFESGVHGTIAEVLVAMTVPARSWINPHEFLHNEAAGGVLLLACALVIRFLDIARPDPSVPASA